MHIDIESTRYTYNVNPDACPLCHQGVEPRIIGSNAILGESNQKAIVEIMYRCPRQTCQHAFIATYKQRRDMRGIYENIFSLINTAPYRGKDPSISDEVNNLSSNFTEIFSQSHTAEHYGLDQIAGVGYRKALEFLIKDYCISKHEDKEEEIKNKFLGVCITEFIDDANIMECARRASWLGNDETHYIRKWEDKDIQDLKILIELTMAWIRNNVLTEQYLADMNDAT